MTEPGLKQQLRADLTTALKSHDSLASAAIRSALAAISTAEVAGKQARELSEDEVVAVLVREVKNREESAAAYRSGARAESAQEEDAKAEVLRRYLPTPLTPEELQQLVQDAVSRVTAEGLTGGRAIGRVMGMLKGPTAGRTDGAELAAVVKDALGMS